MGLLSGGGMGGRHTCQTKKKIINSRKYISTIFGRRHVPGHSGGEYKDNLKPSLPPWGMRWGSSPRLSNGCPPRHDSPRPGLPWLLQFVCRPLRTSLCSLRTCCCVDCTHRDDTDFNRQASSKHTKGFKRKLFIRTKPNMRIFGVIPFIKLQNDT